MSENVSEQEEASSLTILQEVVINEVEEVEDDGKRLGIYPSNVLGSLSHLRIDRARIRPLGNRALVPTGGGNADVEPAILGSGQSSSSPVSDDTEYIAVKKLRFDEDSNDNRTMAMLAHEVSLLNDLSHENVVKIVGFVEDVGQRVAWMVFVWEKNGNLREFIRSANWELPERVCLIYDVAVGLSYLHGRNPPICHGDLKSLNILVNSENRAVITDFGSARAVDPAPQVVSEVIHVLKTTSRPVQIAMETQTAEAPIAEIDPSGEFITMTGPAWTIRWAAPELLGGHLPGLASDIWALGWICWEAVTGNFPFDNENNVGAIVRITKGDLPKAEHEEQFKQIKALCSLMGECWKLDTSERPTAAKCQQLVYFMTPVVPSRKEESGLSTTRSCGLLFSLGWIRMRNGMLNEAREYFEQSLQVAESVGEDGVKGKVLTSIGDIYYLQGDHPKAEEIFTQARDFNSQIGSRLGLADSFRRLGGVYGARSEYTKAEESYIQAREISSQIGDQLGFAQSIRGLGEIYRMRSEYPKAEECINQACHVFSQIGNRIGFAQSVTILGNLYLMRRDLSKAEESYVQARDIYSQVGDRLGFAQCVNNLGDVYLMCKDYPKAQESYSEARDIFSQMGNWLHLAQSVKGLGDVGRVCGNYSSADKFYTQALSIYARLGNRLGMARLLENIGQVHAAREEYTMAEESYSEAQKIYHQNGNVHSLASISTHLAWLHLQQGQYTEAERQAREALKIYGGLGLEQNVAICEKFIEDIRSLMK